MIKRSFFNTIYRTFVLAAILLAASLVFTCDGSRDDFRFVFMTDIHLQPELRAMDGFQAAINRVNDLRPDFVITGGDLVMDADEHGYGRADSLYRLYTEVAAEFEMPVYNAIGNHDVVGWYSETFIDPRHPEYGKEMFKKRVGGGKTYRSFDWKNWHFIILDTVEKAGNGDYTGLIDEDQLAWLKQDLANAGPDRPIIIAGHIPLISVAKHILQGPAAANKQGIHVSNAHEVLQICKPYNIRLVLQGHLHIVEHINSTGMHFITCGAVCGNKWKGPKQGFKEGFLVVDVRENDFTWHYEDYGWDAAEEHLHEDE